MTTYREGTLGCAIRERRKHAGHNGGDFARLVGVDRGHLYSVERAERAPSLDLLLSIAATLGTSVPELLEGTEWDSRARG